MDRQTRRWSLRQLLAQRHHRNHILLPDGGAQRHWRPIAVTRCRHQHQDVPAHDGHEGQQHPQYTTPASTRRLRRCLHPPPNRWASRGGHLSRRPQVRPQLRDQRLGRNQVHAHECFCVEVSGLVRTPLLERTVRSLLTPRSLESLPPSTAARCSRHIHDGVGVTDHTRYVARCSGGIGRGGSGSVCGGGNVHSPAIAHTVRWGCMMRVVG